jgi:hypothetical protein
VYTDIWILSLFSDHITQGIGLNIQVLFAPVESGLVLIHCHPYS